MRDTTVWVVGAIRERVCLAAHLRIAVMHTQHHTKGDLERQLLTPLDTVVQLANTRLAA